MMSSNGGDGEQSVVEVALQWAAGPVVTDVPAAEAR